MISTIFILITYLCASISSAILVCRYAGLPDPRSHGSKNPGVTNVLRLGGKKAAAVVFLLDVCKGFLPIILAKLVIMKPMMIGFIALAAVIGHVYPLFFRFQGGKGVATFIGALLAIHWSLGLSFMLIWLAMAKGFGYSSMAALTATMLMPLAALFLVGGSYFLPLSLIVLLIVYRHRSNIQRLWQGTEPKIGNKH